ncbi:hypothetical protein B0H14DRAFT_3900655 [Mycena olivaceomarginata]|nr:hypothetical protein B0H14DRAFT_3900655 [Mycena olivaceomarginata]
MQRFETPEWPVRPLTACSWSKSKVELLLLRNTGEGGEGTSPSAGANTNMSRSVLPLPLPAPLLRKSTYHHPVSCMNRRHASTGAGEEGHWVYKGCTALVDLEVPLKLLAKPTHPTCVRVRSGAGGGEGTTATRAWATLPPAVVARA